jgi:hypothetical protein
MVAKAQKTPPAEPSFLVACCCMMITDEVHHTEILCKRMSWIVAKTMVRQLSSVVKTSI